MSSTRVTYFELCHFFCKREVFLNRVLKKEVLQTQNIFRI